MESPRISSKLRNIFLWFLSLLDCQKIKCIFLEVWQVLEYLAIFKIFFYEFKKSPVLPEGPRWLFWSFESPGMSCKFRKVFLWFSKVSWIARRSKITFLKFGKSWNVFWASKYFLIISKIIEKYLQAWQIFLDFNNFWKIV